MDESKLHTHHAERNLDESDTAATALERRETALIKAAGALIVQECSSSVPCPVVHAAEGVHALRHQGKNSVDKYTASGNTDTALLA